MPLDIGIAPQRRVPKNRWVPMDPDQPRVQIADEAQYWFLWPFFKDMKARTGKCPALYGRARFAGRDLEVLGEAVDRAIRSAEALPESGAIRAGEEVRPERRDLFASPEKGPLLALLSDLRTVLLRARDARATVVCLGD